MDMLTAISIAFGLLGVGMSVGSFTSRWGIIQRLDGLGQKVDGIGSDLGTKLDHLTTVTVEGHQRIEKVLDRLVETLSAMREDQIRILERQSGQEPKR